jgi:5'-3' exonuclease
MDKKNSKIRVKMQINNNKFLLIDLSYYIFYRYHAILLWYNKAYPDKVKDLSKENFQYNLQNINDEIDFTLLDKYKTIFIKKIGELCKQYGVNKSRVILAKDCPRNTIWRHNHHNKYKANRQNTAVVSKNDNTNRYQYNNEIFTYTYNNILPELKTAGYNIISAKSAEADDIIAVAKKYIRDKDIGAEIVIITNDNDYIQLTDRHTQIYNLKNKNLADILEKDDMTPDEYLTMKVLLGDISDNIISVFKQAGMRSPAKSKLYSMIKADNSDILDKYIADNNILDKYNENRRMIDFNYIPDNIQKEIISAIKPIID